MTPGAVLLLGPILVPMITGVACLAFWKWIRIQRVVSTIGAVALAAETCALLAFVADGEILVMQVGGWAAPFGITLAADIFAAVMTVMGGIIGLAVVIYSLADIDRERESHGYHALIHFMQMGVGGAFVAGDLFNLYVWFEVLLMGSFVLLALGGQRAQLEGAIKYVALSLIASTLLLMGVGMTYGLAGTLNMADLAVVLPKIEQRNLVLSIAMLFMIAFGMKAAMFPLFFWLPASYHTPPVPVSAIFSGLLTKVGVYALIRVFTLLFVQEVSFTHNLILIASGLTMVTGVLGAVAQNEFRRILSFHIISQIGYMTMGLGLFTAAAVAGSIFYIVHHIIVKTNLFLVSGLVRRIKGTYDLKPLGGVYLAHPLVAIAFAVPALSLAGIPPFSGFWAKFQLARAGFGVDRFVIVAVALVVGILTLFSMSKIWIEAFWKPGDESEEKPPALTRTEWALYGLPIAGLALITIAIGFASEPLVELSIRAAEQLMDSSQYIETVLGGGD